MGVHVLRQGAVQRESLAAGGAYVGAVAGMGAHVHRQVATLREGHAACGAGVGAVTGMGALVSRQVAEGGKDLAAGGACVGAVAGMGALVSRQVAGTREGLATDGALKDEVVPRNAPPPLVRPSIATIYLVARRLLPSPLAPDHRKINRLVLRPPECVSGQIRLKFRKKT